MKKIAQYCCIYLGRLALWLRYRITIKGLDLLDTKHLNKRGGILFLPNHPTVFIDPVLITLYLWPRFPIRPLVVEYMYYAPVINWFMKKIEAIPVPNFSVASNSLKKRRAEKAEKKVLDGIKKGENFLIYPAGRVKKEAREIITGSSIHRIIQENPDINIVLVRISGLWGSSFSKAITGKSPPMMATLWEGVKTVFKNLLFFTPRREVTLEFLPTPPDFPFTGSRMEVNQYLESWYNFNPASKKKEGEPLSLVPYLFWKKELPQIKIVNTPEENIDIDTIPSVKQKINEKLQEITKLSTQELQADKSLTIDLGLDSLDLAELVVFLDDEFNISGVPVEELTTIKKLMAIAAKKVQVDSNEENFKEEDITGWFNPRKHQRAQLFEGTTIPEVFLNACQNLKKHIACVDTLSKTLSYQQLKLRVLILANYIQKLPDEYIGILLPSSTASYMTILACQLAQKIPICLNWTAGPKHLKNVLSLTPTKHVISSWKFLDRLENADLTPIEESILCLEEIIRELSLKDKFTAYLQSQKSTSSLLKEFCLENKEEQNAVILFTSGTEGMPKGVPLTHKNILSNQKGALETVELFQNDILLSMLPSFHAFGFTVSGLLPLLSGIRVVYHPNPIDGKGLAYATERFKATIMCGAPTFLRAMFKGGKSSQFTTLRVCFTGAEKAPKELFETTKKMSKAQLLEGYGITECAPILTINKEADPTKGVGQPIPGVSLKIVSLEEHRVLTADKEGLILAKGPNIFAKYLNPNVASPFISLKNEQWYSTGDLGYLDKEGNLIISGRLKRFIKIGGEMVSLGAIEEALQKKDNKENASVAVCAQEQEGEKAKIFLFTSEHITVEEANQQLKSSGFSNLIKISEVKELPELPLTGSGKINYQALQAQIS